jgi:hypothetical protein
MNFKNLLKWLLKRRNRTYLMSGYEPPPDLTCRQLLNFKELKW